MPINPAIEEKVREFERRLLDMACLADKGDDVGYGKGLADISTDIRTVLQDIYQLGVSDGREYQFKQDLEAFKSKK